MSITTIKNPKELIKHCELFKAGAKKMYDEQGERPDMWLFELYHHLDDCSKALNKLDKALAKREKKDPAYFV